MLSDLFYPIIMLSNLVYLIVMLYDIFYPFNCVSHDLILHNLKYHYKVDGFMLRFISIEELPLRPSLLNLVCPRALFSGLSHSFYL